MSAKVSWTIGVAIGAMIGMCEANAEPNVATVAVVEAFTRTCLATLPDTRKVKVLAEVGKWAPLPAELAPLLAPADPKAIWQGWLLKAEQQIVGISVGNIDNGEKANGCVIASMAGEHLEVHKQLLKYQADLELREEKTEAGQHTLIYGGTLMWYPLLVLVSGPIEGPGVTIAGSVIDR